MISIHRSYINALLADATYAIKEEDQNGLIGENMKTHKGINKRMMPIIAGYMGKHFQLSIELIQMTFRFQRTQVLTPQSGGKTAETACMAAMGTTVWKAARATTGWKAGQEKTPMFLARLTRVLTPSITTTAKTIWNMKAKTPT